MRDDDFQFEYKQLDRLEPEQETLSLWRRRPGWVWSLMIGGLVLFLGLTGVLLARRPPQTIATSTRAAVLIATPTLPAIEAVSPATNTPPLTPSEPAAALITTPTIPAVESTPSATNTPSLTSTSTRPPATSTPLPQPTKTPTEVSKPNEVDPLQLSTEQQLFQATIPARDQRLLAMRLKYNGQEIPKIAKETPTNFELGDTDTFWVTDNQEAPPRQFQVTASLSYLTDHAYWWVEEGLNVEAEDLKRSAEQFENNTYPNNRALFGKEWSPGVDSDVRIHIFLGNIPGVAGYFSASDEYSALAEPYSNERELFYINLKAVSPGNESFDGVLAHVFQYMIHWYADPKEDTWVNSGLSELAIFVNGYGVSGFTSAYVFTPDTQLNAWGDSPGEALPHYGYSFLFMAYFLQRYGEEMIQAIVANSSSGITGFNTVLAERGYPEHFEEIFADFLVANYLQDPEVGEGLWGYKNLSVDPVSLTTQHASYPIEETTTVYQYGGDYIELTGQGDLTIEFTGSTRVNVVNNQAYSGNYQWYSHRGDSIDTHLTHAFDLSDVDTATLNYWTWYEIETGWDYGYVEISTDGGKTWTILQTPNSATSNSTGNAFGPGYTGVSGDGPIWVEENIDLSAYTGQEILLRFEYVTEESIDWPGWTIDDIRIPEINFFDDVENGANGWQAEGFVRIENVLPQRFSVQLIEFGDDIKVRSMPLDETNTGTLTVTGLGTELDRAILIISGLTPFTNEPANYQYKLSYVE